MKQLLILSVEDDVSTDNVMRWINYLEPNVDVIRLHPNDIYNNCELKSTSIEEPIILNLNYGKRLNTEKINVIWYRKWFTKLPYPHENKNNLYQLLQINRNLEEEFNIFFDFLIYKIENKKSIYWLNKRDYVFPNKLKQLLLAKEIGLKVPHTFLATNLNENIFSKKIITKNLSNCLNISSKNSVYCTLTSKVHPKDKNDKYSISLFQEEISKDIEIRVFYLSGKCYALAILSQTNSKTKIDYRNYDYENPNREEYYQLPPFLEKKINLLMKKLNLQTGSLDFILNESGEYIFLEVNPSGQYDIFNLCNINPDKLIAQHLIKKYYEY